MKNTLSSVYLLLLALFFACKADKKTPITEENIAEPMTAQYDERKAKAYGADAYGMKKYVMAFLKKGPNRGLDSLRAAELQTAHMQNIGAMSKAGKLVLAGPFFGDGELRGIYVFNVQTIEEAEELTNTDPAIQAGSLAMELKEWYGSAALMAVNDIHMSIAKENP